MNLVKNIEKYLNKHYEFKHNVVKSRTYFKRKRGKNLNFKILKEKHLNSILRELLSKDYQVSKRKLMDLIYSDFVENVNPVSIYFENIPEWDGKDNISTLANTVSTADDKMFQWAFKKWLVALVACSLKDEITNQTALIFVGRQGVGKSRWFENVLLPTELRPYVYSKKINPNDKDHILQLSENILINMEEIGEFNKSQNEAFKELITKSNIRERRAYGVFSEDYVRRASFSGSSNNKQLLNDTTGNRRFLIFEVTAVDFKAEINLDMVYSQALSLFKSGFQFWFNSKDIDIINENNKQFTQIYEEEEMVMKFFELPMIDDVEVKYMNATEIADFIYKTTRGTGRFRYKPVVIGKIMTSKGFKTKDVYEGKNKIKKYIVKLKR